MSQDIISTKFYDQKIDQIRTATEQLNDKYPFLLMPLRLETRYMTVDRPVPGYYKKDENKILFLILELEYLFKRMELVANMDATSEAVEITDRVGDINSEFDSIADQVWTLPYPENKWWDKHLNAIPIAYNIFLENLSKLSSSRQHPFRHLLLLLKDTSNKVQQYKIIKSSTTEHDEAKKLINKLRYIELVFNRITNSSPDYTSKTKHLFFNYIDSQINRITEACTEVTDLAMKNIVATKGQINCIGSFLSLFHFSLTETKAFFSKIPSEFKRSEFLEKFDTVLQPDTLMLMSDIREKIIPKLRYIGELKTVKTSDLLYLVKKIQYELQLINAKGFKDYQELQKVRVHLYGLLRKFRAMGHDIIVGPDWQAAQLRANWSIADRLLNDYTHLVGQLSSTDSYKQAGISRAISHINENYRSDLEGMKREAPENRAFIQNSDFTESAKAHRIAISKMKELAGELESLTGNTSEVLAAIGKLQDFSGEFAVLAIKTTIVPESLFKELHTVFNRLSFSIDKMKTIAEEHSSLLARVPDITASKEEITQSLSQIESDITDEKDPFYDDFRKKFIFADLTETVDELWVRIYPDDIFVNSHEKAITQDELDDTKYFWTEVWNADNDKEVELAAWRPLAIKYGENRASYLYQLLNPDNEQSNGSKPIRPIINLHRKLETAIKTYDKILAVSIFHPTTLGKRLPDVKNGFTKSLSLIAPFTSETFVLLNKAIDLNRQMVQRLKTLYNFIKKIQHQGIIITGATQMLMSDIHAQVNTIGEKLSKMKPVKDITMVDGVSIPDFKSDIETKEDSWSEAPKTNVLPDKFVFLGMNGNEFTHIKLGKSIPNPLIVGINPTSADTGIFEYDDKGNLLVDENTKWLTDFDAAVEKGMGIIVPLKGTEKADGFEKVIVLGVNNTGAEESKIVFEELLESHAFSPEGIGMLPIGTPTNNTESKTSGFSSEEDADKAYARITGDPLYNDSSANKNNIDGHRLSEALGINLKMFNRLENSDRQDTYNSLLMNRSMWNSTMGYYMEEVMDSIFTLDNNRRTNDFFTNFVSGRGWLPAMRIGTQPYGILPTTAFSRYKTIPNEQLPPIQGADFVNLSEVALNERLQKRFDIRLYKLFNLIREQWMEIANNEELKIDDFDPKVTTAQEHFMQLLGLQATSIEQYFRYNTNTAQRRSVDPDKGKEFTVNFSKEATYGPYNMQGLFGQFVNQGYFIDDTYYEELNRLKRYNTMTDEEFEKIMAQSRIKESRIFRLRYHNDFGQLSGPFVRENDDEFLKSVNDLTFIDKLLTCNPKNLWKANQFGELQNNSLFFMFLRQSLALSYRDTALDILMKEKIINENTRRRAGSKGTYLLPGPSGTDIIFTKWDYLFRKVFHLQNMMKDGTRVFERFPLAGKNCWANSSLWNYIDSKHWTMSDYLFQLPDNHLDRSKITELKNNFLELKTLPVNDLERLFAEHMDLCTYRFDAWQLGFANKRLDAMRKKSNGSEGIYLGAFGLLENLKPGGDRDIVANIPEALKENDNKLVYTDKDNEGFIHTPSLNHALTAAILRSGYIANKTAGDLNNPMAVNLTSKRVRMALKLMQGIHNGQDTGALLGYQFERGLHENYLQQGIELDKFIYDLRKQFPLIPDADSDSDINKNEEQSTMNVVNGLKLLEAVRRLLGENALMAADSLYELELLHKTDIRVGIGLPSNITNQQLKAILKEIDEMANAFDALGDLLMSESVYHIAQGNYVRSAAVFADLSEGRAPREAQIIDTPRSGHVLTQRLILQLETISGEGLEGNPAEAKPQHWQNIDFTPRSFAEPSLNKWLGEMIGDPSLIRCYVEYKQSDGDHIQLIKLSDLGLQAIDTVYLMSNPGDDGSQELNKMIAFYIRKTFDLPVETALTIHFKDRNGHLIEQAETLSADIKTFNEVLPLFSSLFETVTKSRATAADDYVIPGGDVPADMNLQQLDVAEIKFRTDKAFSNFREIKNSLQLIFDTKGINVNDPAEVGEAVYSSTEINGLRNALLNCAAYGLSGSLPDAAIETSADIGKSMAKQAVAMMKVMAEKIAKTETLLKYDEDLADKSKIERLTEAAKTLFGSSFVIIPHFTLRNRSAISQVLSLDENEGLLRNVDEFAMDGWVEGIAKVRTKINKLEMVNTMAEMFDVEFPDYTAVQLPFDTIETESGEMMNDFWLGMEYPSDYEPDNDKLSLIILMEENLKTEIDKAKCCGLLIDEWIEIIPEREATTGIAFNYDQPDAEPPQSLLLAVPPVETGKWKWDDLVYTILDTMDLYKARMVEPEHIDKSIFTQVLPAVMGEFPAPNPYRKGIAKLGMFDLKKNNKDIND